MGVQFEWQAGNEGGDWETVAKVERSPRRSRLRRVRWWAWVILAALVVSVAGGAYLVVHRRYADAQRQLAFQIQGVIDLEARAFAQGDQDLFMAQQDPTDTTWRIRQKQRISTFCTAQAAAQPVNSSPEQCAPVLPARVEDVELHREVAWVRVTQGQEPVRRVRFYRRTLAGWKQTSPQAAFWRGPVEFEAPGLLVRYHTRDRPTIDPLIERIAQAHRDACRTLGCAADAILEIEFAVDMPPRALPDPTGRRLTLASPWLSGIPLDGQMRPADLDALSYRVAHAVALQRMSTASGQQSDPLRNVLLTEYAAWSAHQDEAQAPILGRIVQQHGVDALSEVSTWLQDDGSEHTLSALLGRWLGLSPDQDRVAYFQALLDIERQAIVSGRKDTFLFLQEPDETWQQLQAAFYEQAPSQPNWLARSAAQVQSVEIVRDLALVTLIEPPTGIHGFNPQTLGQFAFFSLKEGDWRHGTPLYAMYWEIPLPQLHMPAALPAYWMDGAGAQGSPGGEDAVTITFVDTEEAARLQGWVNAFQESYPQIRIRTQGSDPVLAFPTTDAPPITDISYLYEIVAYPIAWMADAVAWPMPLAPLPLWRDLTPFLEKDADLTFYPFAAAAYQSAGKTWALPWTAQPALIRYDRAAFDAAGVPYPRPGWTQDEFLSIARQMTVREGENIVRYGFVDIAGWPMARAWIEGRAGSLIDRSRTPGVPVLDSPQAIEAVRWYTDLALRHKVMPMIDSGGGMGDNVEPYMRLVERGQAAMWTDTAPASGQYHDRSDVGLVPYPVARYGASPWQVSGLAISNLTPHAQETWLWVRFLSDQDPVGHSTTGSMLDLPARPSMAEATGYWEQWDSETRAVLQDAVEHAWTFRYDECTLPLQRAIDAIWAGQTVEAALAEAQQSALRGQLR